MKVVCNDYDDITQKPQSAAINDVYLIMYLVVSQACLVA